MELTDDDRKLARDLANKINIAAKLIDLTPDDVDVEELFEHETSIGQHISYLDKWGNWIDDSVSNSNSLTELGDVEREIRYLSNYGYEIHANLEYGLDLVEQMISELNRVIPKNTDQKESLSHVDWFTDYLNTVIAGEDFEFAEVSESYRVARKEASDNGVDGAELYECDSKMQRMLEEFEFKNDKEGFRKALAELVKTQSFKEEVKETAGFSKQSFNEKSYDKYGPADPELKCPACGRIGVNQIEEIPNVIGDKEIGKSRVIVCKCGQELRDLEDSEFEEFEERFKNINQAFNNIAKMKSNSNKSKETIEIELSDKVADQIQDAIETAKEEQPSEEDSDFVEEDEVPDFYTNDEGDLILQSDDDLLNQSENTIEKCTEEKLKKLEKISFDKSKKINMPFGECFVKEISHQGNVLLESVDGRQLVSDIRTVYRFSKKESFKEGKIGNYVYGFNEVKLENGEKGYQVNILNTSTNDRVSGGVWGSEEEADNEAKKYIAELSKKEAFTVSENPKDWYNVQKNGDVQDQISYRSKMMSTFGGTKTGIYDMVVNSFYNKGKLKPEEEVFSEEDLNIEIKTDEVDGTVKVSEEGEPKVDVEVPEEKKEEKKEEPVQEAFEVFGKDGKFYVKKNGEVVKTFEGKELDFADENEAKLWIQEKNQEYAESLNLNDKFSVVKRYYPKASISEYENTIYLNNEEASMIYFQDGEVTYHGPVNLELKKVLGDSYSEKLKSKKTLKEDISTKNVKDIDGKIKKLLDLKEIAPERSAEIDQAIGKLQAIRDSHVSTMINDLSTVETEEPKEEEVKEDLTAVTGKGAVGKKIYCSDCGKEVKPTELMPGIGGCIYCKKNEPFLKSKKESFMGNSNLAKKFVEENLNGDESLYEKYIGDLEIEGQLSDGEFENSISDWEGAVALFRKLTNGIDAPKELNEKWKVFRNQLDFGSYEFCASLLITDNLKRILRQVLVKYIDKEVEEEEQDEEEYSEKLKSKKENFEHKKTIISMLDYLKNITNKKEEEITKEDLEDLKYVAKAITDFAEKDLSKFKEALKEFFDSGSARSATTDYEMLQASMAAEQDAASLYTSYADKTSDESLKKLFLDIAKEEEVHAGEFKEALEKVAPQTEQTIAQGEQEAEDKMKSESLKESVWSRYAQTDEQEEAITSVVDWLSKANRKIVGGTTIGKEPQTVLLDLTHHGGEIRINRDGDITVNGFNVYNEEEFNDGLSGVDVKMESEAVDPAVLNEVKQKLGSTDFGDGEYNYKGKTFVKNAGQITPKESVHRPTLQVIEEEKGYVILDHDTDELLRDPNGNKLYFMEEEDAQKVVDELESKSEEKLTERLKKVKEDLDIVIETPKIEGEVEVPEEGEAKVDVEVPEEKEEENPEVSEEEKEVEEKLNNFEEKLKKINSKKK